MSEEITGANAGVGESPILTESEVQPTPTPAGAESASNESRGNEGSTEQVPFHKHPRFQELISQNQQARREIEELRSQLTGKDKGPTAVEKVLQRFTKGGMEENTARLLVEGMAELSSEVAENRVAPIERSTGQTQIDMWLDRFAETHKDYVELRPQMSELFNSLPPAMGNALALHPKGLELIYDAVKVGRQEEEIKKAFDKGVQEGYRRKTEKAAITPSTGAAANTPKSGYSEEDINKMSPEEYLKHRASILASRGMR